MQRGKRLWIYSGLIVPEGVGLVRRPVVRSSVEQRVLLIGDEKAQGLVPPMSRLARDSRASLHVDIRPGASLRDWARKSWLRSHFSVFQSTDIFVALDHRDPLARRMIRAIAKKHGANVTWLVPYGIPHSPSLRYIGADGVDASSFAIWAARAWSVLS